MASSNQDSAEQLAREIARESLFLPERERVWLLEQLRKDLSEVDLERYAIDRLNKRMSDAVEVLGRVAQHLRLSDQKAQLGLTMDEFDAASESVRKGWKARRVAEIMRGSWELAKAVAFGGENLPVVAERQWKYKNQLTRKRREGRFSLTCIYDWLATGPAKKTMAAYDQWREAHNKRIKPGQKAAPTSNAIWRRWSPCSWAQIIEAVEQERLPSESTKQKSKQETQREEQKSADSKALSLAAPADSTRGLILDPQRRAQMFRAARKAHGWTLPELSERTGIERTTLGKIERGKTLNSSFERIAKIAHVLGISMDALVTDRTDELSATVTSHRTKQSGQNQ